MRRVVGVVGVCAVLGIALAGCADESDPGPEPVTTPTETPTPTPDPEAIRDVDFGELPWIWDSQRQQYEVALEAGVGRAVDPFFESEATVTMGDVVYSDANADGLLDAAVQGTWQLSNGIVDAWYVWLAQADEPTAPQQVPYPIAFGGRCADIVDGVEPVDGGFRVAETMRGSLEQSNACAEIGTMQRTRDVKVVGDGTAQASWPVTLDDEGWGGYCPVRVYTEGAFGEAQGRVGPAEAAPETAATGERLFSPIQEYPLMTPEGWRLTGFLPDPDVDDSVVCVWIPE